MWDLIAVGLVVLAAAVAAGRWFYRQATGREKGCPTCGTDCPTCCSGPGGAIGDLRPGRKTPPRP